MVDVCYPPNYHSSTSRNLKTFREMHDRKCYSDPKFMTDSSDPAMILNRIDDDAVLPDVNIANSLIDVVGEVESQTNSFSSRDSNKNAPSDTSKSSSFKMRKKSTTSMLSMGSLFKNSYLDKLKTFKKNFMGTEVESDILLADFSCAFARYSPKMLIQGRLYVTNKRICFYSKIVSFENKLIIPLNGVTGINKEKVAKFIPNSLKIFTGTSKYFFTSFNSRDKMFTIINQVWQYINRNELSLEYMKNIILDCYGSFDKNMLDVILGEHDNTAKQSNISEMTNNVDQEINEICASVGDINGNNTLQTDKDEDDPYNNGRIIMTMDRKGSKKKYTGNKSKKSDLVNHKRLSSTKQKMSSFSSPSHRLSVASPVPHLLQMSVSQRSYKPVSPVNSGPTLSNESHTGIPKLCQHESIQTNTKNFCDTHDHHGRCYIDTVFDIHVDRLYSFLFTNSSFFKRFLNYRKTNNMQIGKWTDSKEHKDDKNRVLNYTLHLKSKLGPKTSVTKEEQILNHRSKCGKYFLMDTFIYNSGFPLADCFHTANRYCLVNAGPNKTKMRVFSHVIFDKPVFFGSKSLIETTSKSGLADYFDELEAVINHEVKSSHKTFQYNSNSFDLPPSDSDFESSQELPNSSVSPSLSEKPDRTHNEPVSDDVVYRSRDNFLTNKNSRDQNSSIKNNVKDYIWNSVFQKERAWLILIVLSLIICLCFSFFYSRFRQLEDITDQQIRLQNQFNKQFADQHNQQNQQFASAENSDELEQWKEVVDKSIDILDQMKQLLVKIKTKIDKMPQQNPVNPSVSPQSTVSNAKSAKESFLEFLHKVTSRKDLISDVDKS